MVETVVVLFSTLLLLLGTIQFGLIYNAKTTLNYAVFEAARAGALNYADLTAIQYGLARGLAPLYTSIETGYAASDKVGKVKAARDKVFQEAVDGRYVCIERVNPNSDAFDAHGIDGEVSHFEDERLIPNDKLLYRSALPKSGVSIQEANLLKLRVTYCYPMYVPIIATTIKRLYGLKPDPRPIGDTLETTPFNEACLNDDRLPIVAQAVIRMQTPVRDSFPSTGAFPKECSEK